MKSELVLLLPIVLPVLCGCAAAIFKMEKNVRLLNLFTAASLVLTAGAAAAAYAAGGSLTLGRIAPNVALVLSADGISGFFAILESVLMLLAAVFSFRYMKNSRHLGRFYSFWMICLGMLLGADFSGNIITLYLFYEMVTLSSFPLVMHDGTEEAVSAGKKYLFYSVAGAFLALFGIAVAVSFGGGADFAGGGVFSAKTLEDNRQLLLAAEGCMILGFGAKCGLFPLHGWLPTAHPVAPAPASAALSGTITKLGVLAVIRSVFYLFGADFVRGTWVQTVWLVLACVTVFMGSMLAWREKLLKKRLAWSTVSQISYILLGLAFLTPECFTGAIMHVAAHACIKNGLFLFAGGVIFSTGVTRVDELRGAGKKLPGLFACLVIFAAALVGIPPASAFLSKWYLASGALASGIRVFDWLAPVILLVSALLTAGYLFPPFIEAFFPGKKEFSVTVKEKPGMLMLVPAAILAVGCVLCGIFPDGMTALAESVCGLVF